MGFGGNIKSKSNKNLTAIYKDVTSHDIVKYGLIPELVGRVPVIVSLENLDEEALVKILKEPKNSLCKQYKKLFGIDGVELEFEEDALRAVADLAIKREIGARGLRTILENIMIAPMYDIPSQNDIKKIVVTKDFIEGTAPLKVIKKAVRAKKSENTTVGA